MSSGVIKVLLVDGNENDYRMTRELLAASRDLAFDLTWKPQSREGLAVEGDGAPDVCLLRCNGSRSEAVGILNRTLRNGRKPPAILLLGPEANEVEFEEAGVSGIDYLAQNEIAAHSLERAIRHAMEQRQHEEKLRKYAFIVNNTLDLMSFVDSSYVYRAVNNAYVTAFQRPREKIVGMTMKQLWGEERFTAIIKPNVDRCLTGEVVHDQGWFEFAALGRRHMAITYSPFREGNDPPSGLVVVSHDVTDLKLAMSRLHQSERLAAIGEALTGISHHIKNILMRTRTSVKLIDDALMQNDLRVVKTLWPIYKRAGDDLANLVARVLNFSRQQDAVATPGDLNELVQEAIELSAVDARMRGIRLECELAPVLPRLHLERSSISDAINNLIGNALEAGADGGCGLILITTQINAQRTHVELAVEDDGPGVPPEIQEKIFLPFFTTKASGGTGLGLAITRKTMAEHGGTLELDSEPGRTRFILKFPMRRG